MVSKRAHNFIDTRLTRKQCVGIFYRVMEAKGHRGRFEVHEGVERDGSTRLTAVFEPRMMARMAEAGRMAAGMEISATIGETESELGTLCEIWVSARSTQMGITTYGSTLTSRMRRFMQQIHSKDPQATESRPVL